MTPLRRPLPSPVGIKSRPIGRVLMAVTVALTVLSLALAAAAQSQPQQPADTLVVSPLKINSARAKNVLPDFRCSKPMRNQPRFPTLDSASRSTIDFGGQLKLSVPQALFTSDFDYVTNRKLQKSPGVSPIVPISLRPTLLAEFCAELPFLLRLESTKNATANAERAFKTANQGCMLLSAIFNSRNQVYANPRPASTSTPPIDGPSNAFEVTLRAIKHITATFKDNGSLIKEPAKGSPPPPMIAMRQLPKTMSPFADGRAVDTFAVVEAVQKAVQEQFKQITKHDGGAEIVKSLAAIEPFAILGFGDSKSSSDVGKQAVVVFAKALAKFAISIETTMVAQRKDRPKKTFPWTTSPTFNVASTVQLNKLDGDNFAKIFDHSTAGGHISFDVTLFKDPVKSVVTDLLAPGSRAYSVGDVQKCKVTKPRISVTINGKPWFSGSLIKNPGTPFEPPTGSNAVMFSVNWFLPANPSSTSVHPTRKVLIEAIKSRNPVRLTFEVSATAANIGTVGCPNLPVLPLTISPAYACNDNLKTAQQKFTAPSQADAFEDDALDFSFTDDTFEDDMWADYSVSGDEGVDEDGFEDSADFAFGDELVWDEDALDEEADFALADEEGADEMFSAGDEVFADEALFDD